MRFHHSHWISLPRKDADKMAAVFSVIPGLGHFYKGHWTLAALFLFVGVPLALWAGILLSLATLGLGMLLPVMFWAGVALHAWQAEDLHRSPDSGKDPPAR